MKNLIYPILLFSAFAFGQQDKSILLTNAYLHVGNGEMIETAAVGIINGEITLVKNVLTYSYSVSDWDTIVNLQGQHLYPGLVAPNSTLGLTEIDAVRATRDYDEVGNMNPHIRALIAYNVESDVIATVRSNGVLITQITPRGGVVTGSSSIMHLDGWNWEDAAISVDDGIHLNWPASFSSRNTQFDPTEADKRKNEYEKKKREIYTFFSNALAYTEKNNHEFPELRLDAMTACFKGNKRVYIRANELQQLVDVIDFVRFFNLKFPVIVGGYDSYLILPQLRDLKIPLMLPRVHSLPENEDDPIDLPFRLPSMLKEANVPFCLQNEGDMEAMNARNIPFLAGHTTGFGLSSEDALRAVSLSPCEIMGIDNLYGSIEVGKKATLFASKGNAFDALTNDVTMALMNGIFVNLDDRQKQLYRKYEGKYRDQ